MAASPSPYSSQDEQRLMVALWDPRIADDLGAFVRFVFPWGRKGTPLEKHKGPRAWQLEECDAITAHIRDAKDKLARGLTPRVYQSATASGRGVGKSSLTSWLILWMMSTRIGSTVIVTANTETQLKTRTWAELGNWHTLAINRHWFEMSALGLRPVEWFRKGIEDQLHIGTVYYYAQGQLWAEDNVVAFAGVHNPRGIMVLFDEASGIPKPIWTITEGFFTEISPYRFHLAFSNPRENTGAFFECFHKHREHWRRRNLDSRTIEGADLQLLQSMIDKHGEDSDEARIEVKGQFPKQGDKQFISRELVDGARARQTLPLSESDQFAALIMGVDPARFGDDKTVIRFRQGRDARSIPPVEMKGADNMAVANRCASLIDQYQPDAICIDSGNGGGIIDRLKEMKYKGIHEVLFGAKAEDHEWANRRTELWARMRDWLGGALIDGHQDLIDDLTGPQYKFQSNTDKLRLETKEELKARGFDSPDHGDALACTFYVRVARRDQGALRSGRGPKVPIAKDIDYNIFG